LELGLNLHRRSKHKKETWWGIRIRKTCTATKTYFGLMDTGYNEEGSLIQLEKKRAYSNRIILL
jgi:hypothetical protein